MRGERLMPGSSENTIVVNDRMANLIIRMANQFFSEPGNVEKYNQWHLQKFGVMPDILNSSEPIQAGGKKAHRERG